MRVEVEREIERVGPHWDRLAPRDAVGLERQHLSAVERSGINACQPFYLTVHDDGAAVGIAHCFVMEMDLGFLERDLPRETLKTLRSWHRGFLKTRLLECGFLSGLGEAIAAGEASDGRVRQVAVREMQAIARANGAELVLVRDIPASRFGDYADLAQDGFQPLAGFPIARMGLRWRSLDEYLAALKATSRYRIRHLLSKSSPELTSEVLPSFGRHAERLLDLWRQTHQRARDYSHEQLNAAYFREIDRSLGERSRLVVLKRHGEIVAFSLCLLGDREYFSSHAGFDYAQAEHDNLHFRLSLAVLEDAIAHGASVINRGITTYDVKFALGFEAEPQAYLVKHVGDPRLTPAIARRLREAMPQPVNDHRPFKQQDLASRADLKAFAASLQPPAGAHDAFDKADSFDRADNTRLAGLYVFFPPFESAQGPVVRYRGRPLVMLGSNAYLGLGTHPAVVAASEAAIEKYGTGCSGSPFLNGTLDIHAELAGALARFMCKEDAILCSTGYQTNVGVVAALVGKDEVVVMDQFNHASLVDGARMAQAEVARFRHNDVESLEQVLRRQGDRGKLIVVDSVFSMEGTIADLPAIVALARRYGARLMVDEAHAIGVLGPGGRGGAEAFGVLDQVDIVMGTFSKSFASVGGFVAGKARIIDYLRHNTRSHMFSASLPPASVAAARAALDIIEHEPERRARLLANAEFMARKLQELGYEAPYRGTAIVPVHCGRDLLAFALFKKLLEEGVFVNPVAHPAVPQGHELLRTSYMATHERWMLEQAASLFARVRTESFPRRASASARPARAARAAAPLLRVRPMVILPLADRHSLARHYSPLQGRLHVPGFTRLELGEAVDCGISFGHEGVIVQAQGRVVSKRLLPRPGQPLGIELELLPGHAREWLQALLAGGPLPVARRSWRYHAEIDVEYTAAAVEPDRLSDIGLDGAAIYSQRALERGEVVPLRLKVPALGTVELAADVRWRRDGATPAYGVQFRFDSEGERERLRQLIGGIRTALANADTPSGAVTVH